MKKYRLTYNVFLQLKFFTSKYAELKKDAMHNDTTTSNGNTMINDDGADAPYVNEPMTTSYDP